MFRIKLITNLKKYLFLTNYCTKTSEQFVRPNLKFNSSKREQIGFVGWLLFLVPTTTFGLGTWQVQRKKWKENLITDLQTKSHLEPVPLPEDLSELNDFEFRPVYVKGHFIHGKELYLGPRSLIEDGDSSTKAGLISASTKGKNSGYLVVTPFQLADRDLQILVNRGWVSSKKKDPRTRQQGQIENEVELIGIVRLHENRPNFMPANKPESNTWFYRDLDAMSRITNSAPVYLDVIQRYDVNGGPIGGQTRVTLRNEHLSYIITWYGLSLFTSLMWYRQFVKKLPLI